jgi:lactoylglutathione lyase
MKFVATILYVPDVRTALEFYERAFGFSRAFLSDGGDYGELDTGDVRADRCRNSLATKTVRRAISLTRRSRPPFLHFV